MCTCIYYVLKASNLSLKHSFDIATGREFHQMMKCYTAIPTPQKTNMTMENTIFSRKYIFNG